GSSRAAAGGITGASRRASVNDLLAEHPWRRPEILRRLLKSIALLFFAPLGSSEDRQEWMIGNLPAKSFGPPAGHRSRALGAEAVRGDFIFLNSIAVPGNQKFAASGAIGIFQVANHPRKIARIDVMQAGAPPDLGSSHECVRRGVLGGCHFIVPVKRRKVPGDVRRNASEELGHPG